MAAKTLEVQVVSAQEVVWGGEALSCLVRTTEGDIGILPNHEPFLAALVPCAAEVLAADGTREIIALDSGFVSVSENHVSVIAPNAALSQGVNLEEVEASLREAEKRIENGQSDEETMALYHKSVAHIKAVQKLRELK